MASSTDPQPSRRDVFDLEGVAVTFGDVRALQGVTLRVAEGEAVGFVGPSGSGKTTLLRLLNGTVRATDGWVRVDGRALVERSPREIKQLRAQIGFVHQDLGLVPNVRVSQNVLAGRLGHWGMLGSVRRMLVPTKQDLAEVHALLERVGIPDKLFARTDTLSGGQRQRVALARALFQQPKALLADEPVSSVDPARARDTVSLLTSISAEESLTLCMSLHNLDLAREFFPRLVGLRGGRVIFDRASSEIGDAEFHALYDLGDDEMLADGA